VLSQVVLSLQLPFAVWPLVRMTSDRRVIGPFASGRIATMVACIVFAMICGANLWLLVSLVS
jgi:manganese transport protein